MISTCCRGWMIILLFSFVQNVFAQNFQEKQKFNRPKVGLVLSGGGAKGFAYIGMLKVLEEVKMPIDYIGGSSIGAIVAGLYSVGYSPETIEELIRNQDWSAMISDKQEREFMAYEEKQFGDKYIFSIPIHERGITISRSLSGSFNIDMMLNQLFAPASHITDFNDLPIPFLCIGTDLLTGETVILDSGNIARAVRASMAIPGYFSPTYLNGHYMVDGGIVNNYPAEQVKNLGADIIIGGDVQAGLKDNINEIGSAAGILDQVMSFYRIDANKKGLAYTDYYMRFKMPYGMMDFTEFDSIIAFGEKVSRRHYPQLKALADSINSLSINTQTRKRTASVDSIYIKEVLWSNQKTPQKQKFFGYFNGINKSYVSFSEIERRMKLLKGSKSFYDIHYELESDTSGKSILKVVADEPNKGSFSAGVHYDNIYYGSILVNMALRNIRGGRAKVFADLALSQNPRLDAMFIINNGFKPGFGLSTDLYSFKFSQYKNGEKSVSWKFDNISAGVFMPVTIKNDFLFKLGFQYELFKFKQDVVVDSLLAVYSKWADYGDLYASFKLDTRDKVFFSNSGQFIELKFKYVFPFSNKWDDFISNATVLYLKYDYHLKLSKRFVLTPSLFAGYTHSKPNIDPYSENSPQSHIPAVQHLFGFGGLTTTNYVEGFIPFTGLHFVEKLGVYAGKISTSFQYNYLPKLYATLLIDAGFNELDASSITYNSMLLGYGLKFSYESFIGPVEFSIMDSNINSLSYFLNVGFWF